MEKPLLKALYAFIMMMLSLSTTKAQIVFTDVNPDILRNCNTNSGCSGNYSLDLEDDGIIDFILAPGEVQNSCGACNSLILIFHGGYSAGISSTAHSWISDTVGGYALNTQIDSSLSWDNASHVLSRALDDCVQCTTAHGSHFVDAPPSGPWSNIHGKYLALKTQVGADFYYGWIKLGVGININFVTLTIMEYAYNSIPNQPILAGQTMTTGVIENSFASSINLFPNPANDQLTIVLGSNHEKVQVTIADITAKVVYTTIATDTQEIEVDTKDFIPGIYMVQIQAREFIGIKKLVVEK